METQVSLSPAAMLVEAIHYVFRSVPITCFGMALLTDIFYWQTSNLLWLHFSEWLLLAGAVFAGLALLMLALDYLIRRIRPSWLAVLGGLVVLILAVVNNLVHTADGWTAVVPYGMALSAATVLAMIVTAWLGRRGAHHA